MATVFIYTLFVCFINQVYCADFKVFNIYSKKGRLIEYQDVFSNLFTEKKYCSHMKGTCSTETCRFCICPKNFIFVSIKFGCMNYTEAIKLYSDSVHGPYVKRDYVIQSLDNKLKKNGRCNRLDKKFIPDTLFHSCTVKNFYAIHAVADVRMYAQKENVIVNNNLHEPPYLFNGNQCFQCFDKACDLSKYKGMAAVLNVDCLTEMDDSDVTIALLVRISGTFISNETKLVTHEWEKTNLVTHEWEKTRQVQSNVTDNSAKKKSHKKNENHSKSVVIPLAVISGVLVLIGLLAYIRIFHRKLMRRKKTRIAHTLPRMDKKVTNDDMINDTENKIANDKEDLYMSQANPIYDQRQSDTIYTSCKAIHDTLAKDQGNMDMNYASTENSLYTVGYQQPMTNEKESLNVGEYTELTDSLKKTPSEYEEPYQDENNS